MESKVDSLTDVKIKQGDKVRLIFNIGPTMICDSEYHEIGNENVKSIAPMVTTLPVVSCFWFTHINEYQRVEFRVDDLVIVL